MQSEPRPRIGGRNSYDDATPKPFLKWAGGKWSLVPLIEPLLPKDLEKRTYREPFVGGGALFFALAGQNRAKAYVLSDALEDLVLTYEAVKSSPKELYEMLVELRDAHSEKAFYEVRDRYNGRGGSPLERAAWLIYLNKTCFNGLYRTNRSGEFNVPMGRFANPYIAHREKLKRSSDVLQGVKIFRAPFEKSLEEAAKGDVVYMDPPYVPLSKTANFDSYSGGTFGPEQQQKLADKFRELDERGCLLLLSNSDTPEVRAMYKGFDLTEIDAARSISSRSSTRGPVTELVVRNTARWPKSARG